ncbi:hypothetical protein QFC24_004079 [Naganishia onofrii]|uniref:Uncharacterized protein n=1 Tax=Naganishia onofrii TaxID=1851511 RepID=A0ACC2XHY3_9TREE|nr:hypothetical protein QFC24_004079 [Naganishia onofrii]
MTTDHTSTSSDPPSISEATNDVRLSITPDLYDALSSLIQYSAQVDLPLKLGQAVQVCLTSYDQANQRNEIRLDDVAQSLEKDKGGGTEPADTHRYSLIALCAGTKTYTTPAQERLIQADPDAASHFLPSHLAHATSSAPAKRTKKADSSGSLGAEYRSASKEISAVLNVLFSIGGVGGAVFVVAKTSAGMRQETAILLAFLAAIVVGIAETWLYISHARRSAKRYAEGEEIRRAIERQAGPSLSVEEVDEDGEKNASEPEIASNDVDQDDAMEKTAATAGSSTIESRLGNVHQTSRQDASSRQTEIRLRRKPLTGPI